MTNDSIHTTSLNTSEILLTISGTGNFVVDLAGQGMVHSGELLMVLELLEAPDREGRIYIGGQAFGPATLFRRGAGEPWREGSGTGIPISLAPSFRLTVLE